MIGIRMRNIFLYICILCTSCAIPSPEVVYIQQPIQENSEPSDSQTSVWTHEGYQFKSLATYRIEGRVLSTNRHRFGPAAKLAPLDFVLGWGNMADPHIYKTLNVVQSGRFYTYRTTDKSPSLSHKQFFEFTSNTHLVPKDKEVYQQLKSVKTDQIVVLEGHLVSITGPNEFSWYSSMHRTDTGNGACELMWVDKVEIVSL